MKYINTFFAVWFCFVTIILHGQDYQPPVGIPAPPFGINEKVEDFYTEPTPWNQEVPGWYFINQYHPNSSDSNTFGTPNNPRITIPDPIPAGSVVRITGVYDFAPSGYDLIIANGTINEPVFIIGDPQTSVLKKWIFNSTYTIIENIEFTELGKVNFDYPSHHVSIRNCTLHHIAGKIGGSGSSSTERTHHIVIFNNYIHSQDGWDQNPNIDLDNHAIKFSRNVDDVWVLENTGYNNGGSFIQIGDYNTPTNNTFSNRFYIGKNIISANRQSPIGVKQSSDVIISENTLFNNRVIQTNEVAQAGVLYQYGPERLWVLNNKIYDSDAGIISGSNSGGNGQEQYFVGNLIYNTHIDTTLYYNENSAWSPAAIMLAGGINKFVINNTIFDIDAGINCPSGIGFVNMIGNIISKTTRANHIFIEHQSAAQNSLAQNNLLYQNGTNTMIRWGNNSIITVLEFENLYPSQGINNQEANPLFIDETNYNLQLQQNSPSSPAINFNIEAEVYQRFTDLYGLDIRKDILQVIRPQENLWDIGCFEAESILSSINIRDFTNKIILHPNPTSGFFTISLNNQILDKAVIYNQIGKVLQISLNNKIDISMLPTGVYFVKIISKSGKIAVKKITKK